MDAAPEDSCDTIYKEYDASRIASPPKKAQSDTTSNINTAATINVRTEPTVTYTVYKV